SILPSGRSRLSPGREGGMTRGKTVDPRRDRYGTRPTRPEDRPVEGNENRVACRGRTPGRAGAGARGRSPGRRAAGRGIARGNHAGARQARRPAEGHEALRGNESEAPCGLETPEGRSQ